MRKLVLAVGADAEDARRCAPPADTSAEALVATFKQRCVLHSNGKSCSSRSLVRQKCCSSTSARLSVNMTARQATLSPLSHLCYDMTLTIQLTTCINIHPLYLYQCVYIYMGYRATSAFPSCQRYRARERQPEQAQPRFRPGSLEQKSCVRR